MNRLPRRMKILIFISLAAGAAVPAVLQLMGTDVVTSLSSFPLWMVSIPFIFYVLIYAVDAVRLQIVLKHFGRRAGFSDRFVNGVVGAFYSNITPMAAGGQPAQILHLVKCGTPGSESTAIILVRFVEYLVLSLLITVYGIIRYRVQINDLITSGNIGASILIFGLALYFVLSAGLLAAVMVPGIERKMCSVLSRSKHRRIAAFSDKIRLLSDALDKFRDRGFLTVAADFSLGAVNLVLQALSLWILLERTSSIPGGFPAVFTSFVLLNTVAYFVPSPGGSGGIEGAYTVFFSLLAGSNTAAAVLIWRFGSYYLHLGFQIIISFFNVWRKDNENSNVELILLPSQGRDREVC